MNSAMPWVKLWTRLLNNPTFAQMPEPAQLRFFKLLMLAGQCDAGGGFFVNGHQMDEAEIAWNLHDNPELLTPALQLLSDKGFMYQNGRGWEVAGFMDDQGPSTHEKREYWKDRQKAHREKIKNIVNVDTQLTLAPVNVDTGLTDAPRVKSQSQSQSQEKSQSQSQSSAEIGNKEPTEADRLTTLTKENICEIVGIPKKYKGNTLRSILTQDPTISPVDLLAELARNYGRGTAVKNPGMITALNLIKHELPGAEWYLPQAWSANLPAITQEKLAPVISELEKTSEQVNVSGYTHGQGIQNAIDRFLNK